MTRSTTHFMAFALCLLGSSARADVAPPEPTSCPHGGTPSTCHGGPYCALEECDSDADCVAGTTVCRELSLCVGKVVCAGLLPPDANVADYERPTVEGSCANGASCPATSSCGSRRICAPLTPEPARKKHEGGGCAVHPGVSRPDAPSTLAILLGLVALLLARRRHSAGRLRREVT